MNDQLPHFFEPADRTLPRMLSVQAQRFPTHSFVTFGDVTWTFSDAEEVAASYAGILQSAGIKKHDRIALICGNGFDFLSVLLGCAWLGAVLVPINTASRGAQLQHILSNSGAELLVIDPDFIGNLDHIDFSRLTIKQIWTTAPQSEPSIKGIAAAAMPSQGPRLPAAELQPSDMFAILYTSGTTGPSKGVCCPHAQYYWWAFNSWRVLELKPDDILSTTLPLFHNNALNTFFQALILGAHMILEKRFSKSAFFGDLAKNNATVTFLLGAMVPILLSAKPHAAERAHRVRIALSPGTPARFHSEFLKRTGIPLVEGWGSTETNFVIGTTVDRQQPGMIGTVAPGFQARVVDDQDNELPDGQAGELLVRADAPFAFATGYYGAPEKTVEAWRNLWFHTGDRVVREADGYFRFIDRIKDAIRRRGENISSYEVEQVFLSHPGVANAAAYPVRSSLAEDEVMVSIILGQGEALTEMDLIKFCEPRLPYFAVPRFIEIVDALPMTENGKVQKYKLSERGAQATTFDLEATDYKIRRH